MTVEDGWALIRRAVAHWGRREENRTTFEPRVFDFPGKQHVLPKPKQPAPKGIPAPPNERHTP